MQLLNRLKLWQKLALLVAAMAVPTALLGVFYLSAANSEVTQARGELAGAGYAHQVGAVLADIANHRSILFAVLTGDTVRRYELTASELAIDKEMADIDRNDSVTGSRLGVTDDWQTIKGDWQQLKSGEMKLSADDAVAQHDALIARIRRLGNLLEERSGLNVDPSPQTASLIQIATRDVPGALIASGNVQWYATRASIKGYLGGDDQMALHLYHDEVAGLVERFNNLLKPGEPRLYAPHIKFNREIGRWAGQKFHPQTGEPVEDKVYEQSLTEWLPTAADKKLLLDILGTEKKWIVPKEGARDPLESIGETRKSAINP